MSKVLGFCFLAIFGFKNSLFLENNAQEEKISTFASDTCIGQTFKPACPNGKHTLLMVSATYGRMQVGKCITQEEVSGVLGQDPKYFGCFSNVLDIIHKKCSLKNSCEVKLPDDDLSKTKPCFPGLMVYLKTEFRCINVVDGESSCKFLVDEIPKYLTLSDRKNVSMCGTKFKPWIIEAPRGQQIKLTLEHLNNPRKTASNMDCQLELGYVIDRPLGRNKNVTLCSNGRMNFDKDKTRLENYIDSDTYTSTGSIIELILNSLAGKDRNVDESGWIMLLKIEAEGCSDIIPPEDTWLKRNNDDIVIGCYSTKQTWYLRCEHGKWSGVVGNCSIGHKTADNLDQNHVSNENIIANVTEEQQIILFVAICALGLVICVTIVCIGAICIKKVSGKSGAKSVYNKQPMYYPSGQYPVNCQTLMVNQQKSTYAYPENCASINIPDGTDKSDENKYFILETDQTEP